MSRTTAKKSARRPSRPTPSPEPAPVALSLPLRSEPTGSTTVQLVTPAQAQAWLGLLHPSQRVFGITRARAEASAAQHGGTASLMPTTA